MRVDEQEDEEQDQNRKSDEKGDDFRLDLKRFRSDIRNAGSLVRNPVSPHQQTVRVDAVGRAGHERDQVLSLLDLQSRDLGRQHDRDLVDLIGVRLVKNPNDEGIPLDQLVEVREELGRWKSPVTGQDGVRAFPADGKRASFDMAGGDLKDGVGHAVVDRKRDLDLLDFDIAHDAGSGDVEDLVIFEIFTLCWRESGVGVGEGLIVGSGFFQNPIFLVGTHVIDGFGVVRDGSCGVKGVPPVGERRIEHDAQSQNQNEDENHGGLVVFNVINHSITSSLKSF